MSEQTMLVAENVSRRFSNGSRVIEAVKDASISVAAGEFWVIEGISGSGKSTLLYLLGGLDRPTSGRVWIDGADITPLNESKLAAIRLRKVGFVFQSFNLIPTLNTRDNVEAALVPTVKDSSARRDRAQELLALTGIAERWNHLPGRLSGGEQQRVAIARALANDPKLVLADEPTGDLDTKTGHAVLGLMRELCERKGTSVVVVTHAPYVAEYADRRASMADGVLSVG